MKANDVSLKFLGQVGELEVPFFQRNYVWDQSNWEELLESLEQEQLPFLGAIVLKKATDKEGIDYHVIVDGQQRLTTITILVKAIFDILPSKCHEPGAGQRTIVEGNLFYKKNATDGFDQNRLKITHSRVDRKDYARIIKAGLFEGYPAIDWREIPQDSTSVVGCYRYYCEVLSGKSEDELNHLLNLMFNDQRHVFVRIILEENDSNEQRIFDTINRAGVQLTAADIIKNNLFRICLDRCVDVGEDRDDVCKLYDDKWESIFSHSVEEQAVWDLKRIFGNVQRTNLEFLLYCYATIKWGQSKDLFSDLERIYTEHLTEMEYGQLKETVREIHDYAVLYRDIILDLQQRLQNEDYATYFCHSQVVEHLLLILERFGVQMFYPYVLKRLKDVNGNYEDEKLKRDFRILESFVVRRRLSGRGVTDYSRKCNQILHESGSNGNPIVDVLVAELVNNQSGLADTDIKDYLTKPNTETAKIILFCIELFMRDNPAADVNSLTYTYTLEHILPQKWEAHWSDVPVVDENGQIFIGTEEERKNYRDKALRNLGNMLLLKRRLNTAIGNSSFENKNENNNGYKKWSELKTTAEALVPYKNGDKVWDEKHIYDREKKLVEQILTIWPNYAELIETQALGEAEQEEEVSEAISPTVDDFSEAAFADPLQLIAEMDNLQGNVEGSKLWETSVSFQYDQELKEFWEFIVTMKMTLSYKPVFLLAFLKNADGSGTASLDSIAVDFYDFYNKRKMNNEIVEKPGSDAVVLKDDFNLEEAKSLILRYPYDRFKKQNIMLRNNDDTICFEHSKWSKLSTKDFSIIKEICNKKIEQYYDAINNNSNE